MWIIIAAVLLLYVLGLLLICFLSTDHRREGEEDEGDVESPSNIADNNSLSASSNTTTRGNTRSNNGGSGNSGMRSLYNHFPSPHPHHHHRQLLQRYYQRLFFSRLVSSNFRYDDQEDDESRQGRPFNSSLETSSTSVSASASPTPDPARSSLFAYRQQQLRQIHHEINEMSYLLGASQQHSQSDERITPRAGVATARRSFPVPIFGRSAVVIQPQQGSPYSFIYQMASASPSTMTSGESDSMRRDSCIGSGSSCTTTTTPTITSCNTSNINVPITTTSQAADTATAACLSNSLTFSPSTSISENCHIVRERQRRLRHIRMELEGLSLQLNNADGNGGGGTTLRTSNFSPLIYFDVGEGGDANGHDQDGMPTRSLINAHGRASWSASDDEDDLPGYESIVCYTTAVKRVVGTSSSEEQEEDTPPPSYSEAVHLYSFAELEGRRK